MLFFLQPDYHRYIFILFQIGDKGLIEFNNGNFCVTSVENLNGYILHKGFFESQNETLKPQSVGRLKVDYDFRLSCMRNHTSTHLLNASLKKLKGATCQKSSKVTDRNLTLDVALFGDKLTIEDIIAIEKEIQAVISFDQQVEINDLNSQKLLNLDYVTLIPGEVYPEVGIRLVEIKTDNLISR